MPTEEPTAEPTAEPTEEPEITPAPTEVPDTEPIDPEHRALRIYSGGGQRFAVMSDGSLWGWGRNQYGQVGNGANEFVSFPVPVAEGLTPVIVGETVFALSPDGNLWGWGRNDGGDLGLGDTADRSKPEAILPFVKEVTRYHDGWYALTESGDLYKWGFNPWDTSISEEQKTAACTPTVVFRDVSFFDGQYLITRSGVLYRRFGEEYVKAADKIKNVWHDAWAAVVEGKNGRLYELDPANGMHEICTSFRSVTVSDGTAYVLMKDGALYSYCINGEGGILGASEDKIRRLIFIMDGVEEFYAGDQMGEDWGYYYRFALKKNGELWSWGLYDNAMLGMSEESISTDPALVATDVETVSPNGYNTCVIKKDGTLWVTGNDTLFGPRYSDECESFGFVMVPFEAKIISVFNFLRIDYYDDEEDFTDWVELCAATYIIDENGRIWAWGWNGDGLLGVLSNEDEVSSPMPVVKLMNTED